jgi:hypothetical protein
MPKYFFDVINGEGPMRDDEGVDLPDQDAVRREVAMIVTGLARDEVPKEQAVKIVVNVRDEADTKVFVGQLQYSGDWQG